LFLAIWLPATPFIFTPHLTFIIQPISPQHNTIKPSN
jgi:hypothetical protein